MVKRRRKGSKCQENKECTHPRYYNSTHYPRRSGSAIGRSKVRARLAGIIGIEELERANGMAVVCLSRNKKTLPHRFPMEDKMGIQFCLAAECRR